MRIMIVDEAQTIGRIDREREIGERTCSRDNGRLEKASANIAKRTVRVQWRDNEGMVIIDRRVVPSTRDSKSLEILLL